MDKRLVAAFFAGILIISGCGQKKTAELSAWSPPVEEKTEETEETETSNIPEEMQAEDWKGGMPEEDGAAESDKKTGGINVTVGEKHEEASEDTENSSEETESSSEKTLASEPETETKRSSDYTEIQPEYTFASEMNTNSNAAGATFFAKTMQELADFIMKQYGNIGGEDFLRMINASIPAGYDANGSFFCIGITSPKDKAVTYDAGQIWYGNETYRLSVTERSSELTTAPICSVIVWAVNDSQFPRDPATVPITIKTTP